MIDDADTPRRRRSEDMSKVLGAVAGVLTTALVLSGCSVQADVDKAPVGAKVDVTTAEGALVSGTLAAKDAASVTIDRGRTKTTLNRVDVSDIRVVDPSQPAAAPPPKAKFREVTVPTGTHLEVKLESALASDSNQARDPVRGTLTDAVSVEGVEVWPAGSAVDGVVSEARPSGKVKGRASLGVQIDRVADASVDAEISREAPGTRGDDAAKIGVGAAAGAIVGGLIGGGKGAAAGAAVGGGAGTAVVLSTSGEEVRFPAGSVLRVTLRAPVEVKVPIRR
jgi:hypothetical protein